METTIMFGMAPAQRIKDKIKAKTNQSLVPAPCLAVVSVGNDPASATYVKGKEKDCIECGIVFRHYHFEDDVSELDLLAFVKGLSDSDSVDGVIVQLPLPKHIDENKIINSINPKKDVDCFHPYNVGQMMIGNSPIFLPCTPSGVIEMLKYYEVEISGKNCVVIGRSNIVGKPMAHLLMQENGTVTICHSKTKDIKQYTTNADIIVCAVGQPKFLTEDMVKEGCVIVDVGINRGDDGKLCGDVDYDAVARKASYITPVPKGVGLMTRAMLLDNVVKAWENK